MNPSPPKGFRSKVNSRPFYVSDKKTSSEIISEARSTIRKLDTQRPFTPAVESTRKLFVDKKREGRPPSAFSIANSYSESRPPTAAKRLSPIHQARSNNGRSISPATLGQRSNTDHVERWLENCDSYTEVDNNEKRKQESFEQTIKPLLKQMELNHLHRDFESLLTNFDVLWKTLESADMLGKGKLDTKQRSAILTAVYKCASDECPQLLLKLAKLFLKLEVSNKNLEAVAKILFRVSRQKKHDVMFLEEQLIGPILQVVSVASDTANCTVYLVGALKFLSLNPAIAAEMVKYDVMRIVKQILLDNTQNTNEKLKENSHMLVQVVSCLANLANDETLHKSIISHIILPSLFEVVKRVKHDKEFISSYSRLLSKLSMNPDTCYLLHEDINFYDVVLDLIKTYMRNEDIAVRMCYLVGNFAAHVKESQEILTFCHRAFELYTNTGKHYLDLVEKECKKDNNVKEDVLVKVNRIIANLSMDEVCAHVFTNEQNCIDLLLRMLEISSSEEVQNSAVGALNNLSYFATVDSYVNKTKLAIARALLRLMGCSDRISTTLEVTRALGNLSQHPLVRDVIAQLNGFDLLGTLFESDNVELLYATSGVLINLMLDVNKRHALKPLVNRIVEVLRSVGESDWYLSGLVCQLLYNYTEKNNTTIKCFEQEQADDLITLLREYLDEDLALDYEDSSIHERMKESWTIDFQSCATKLLTRLESIHSDLEPLDET